MIIAANGKTVDVTKYFGKNTLHITVVYYNGEYKTYPYGVIACQAATHHTSTKAAVKKINAFFGSEVVRAGVYDVYKN
jgi:hypothetical protein